MAESKLAQGHMNGAGAVQRALDGYNAPGSVDYAQTLERTGHGFQDATEAELKEYKRDNAVKRALSK